MTKKIIILAKYLNFIDIFSKKLALKLLKISNINKYVIYLEPDKQLFYKLIYNLKSFMKLKTLKTYIKINLINNFI